jgi:hypothetical protein
MRTSCKHHYLIALLTACTGATIHVHAQDAGFFLNDWTARNISVPAYNETSKPTATATATVTIDAATVVNKVSKYLFGSNCNPYMTQMVTEPTLINHIKNLSPNIIRMPGGNISSVYFWNAGKGVKPADAPDSILDADGNKIPGGYWFGNNTESWTLSLANYYNMLQQTNSTGIITVNYGYARYGTGANPVAAAAHLAADWVRYDNGRTRFWEIGNESNGAWQAGYRIDVSKNKDGQPEFVTGDLYGKHFKVFADSMKSAAQQIGKTIYIGAQLLEKAPESWQTNTDKSWNQGVLAQAATAADFYIVHSYYTPYNTNSTAADILATATTNTAAMMQYLQQNTQANNAPLKPVALTEYNIFAVGSKQMVSHINGMHAVLVLGELIKNKYGEASRWDLSNAWDNGNDQGTFSAGDEPGVAKWTPRPSFYHMYYFQKYFGDQMISSTVSGSADVVGYASTFSSGQAGLVIVNKGTAAQTVQVAFQHFVPGARYYWYTLTGDTDNGEFSRKVLVNGNGPAGVAGGPDAYADLKPNSAAVNNDVRITAPARSVSFVLIEKSSVTAVNDIDPNDKLIKVFPNPSRTGLFTLGFTGFTQALPVQVTIATVSGQPVSQQQCLPAQQVNMGMPLPKGVYTIKVETQKGTTVKRLVVH